MVRKPVHDDWQPHDDERHNGGLIPVISSPKKMTDKPFNFNSYVRAFRKAGYRVAVSRQKVWSKSGETKATYDFASVTGKNIRGGFSNDTSETAYPYLRCSFAADHAKCFDKWSKCPMKIALPYDLDAIFAHLKFLGSPAGYRISNSFEYLFHMSVNPFLNDDLTIKYEQLVADAVPDRNW